MSDQPVFERTRSGKIGKFNFYKCPIIWVEGDDDLVFFDRLIDGRCRLEVANGRSECEFLIAELIEYNWPYGVVVDGDYRILEGALPSHDRVVNLCRYAIENFLFELGPIRQVCKDYMANQDEPPGLQESYDRFVAHLHEALKPLVVLDMLNDKFGRGIKCFPDNAAEFLTADSLQVNRIRIAKYEANARAALSSTLQDDAVVQFTAKCGVFIDQRGIQSVLRGHFVLGVIRHFLFCQKIGCKIDNRGLLVMLASNVWRSDPSPDHVKTRKALLELVAKVRNAWNSFSWPVQLPLPSTG